jgi:hypothetical protein
MADYSRPSDVSAEHYTQLYEEDVPQPQRKPAWRTNLSQSRRMIMGFLRSLLPPAENRLLPLKREMPRRADADLARATPYPE